ncbi:MAG: hypothetical protein HC925_06195 [Coleofasciculaceae cyanobacterium SM2_3_26]|nr:hypothetical protein [Coleofasciculaceae cyanobacterium SM2_3_26]
MHPSLCTNRGDRMGTYYGLGIVNDFSTRTVQSLTAAQLEQAVDERLNLELFEIQRQNGQLVGNLKAGVFESHGGGFLSADKAIANCDRRVDEYFQEYGTNMGEYPDEFCSVYFRDSEGNEINLRMTVVFLFLEGKVGVEEFDIEPLLLNWLFRHSDFENPLAGAVMSSIVG